MFHSHLVLMPIRYLLLYAEYIFKNYIPTPDHGFEAYEDIVYLIELLDFHPYCTRFSQSMLRSLPNRGSMVVQIKIHNNVPQTNKINAVCQKMHSINLQTIR